MMFLSMTEGYFLQPSLTSLLYRYQDFVVTEIDSQGQLVELIANNISSANENKNCQNINRNGKHKERIFNEKCSEGKSLEKEMPFLVKV